MDGLLILLLIGWLVSQMSKKNKQPKSAQTLNAQKDLVEKQKAARQARVQAELDKRRAEAEKEQKNVQTVFVNAREAELYASAMEPAFRGSMEVESTEGECLCDPELEHERENAVAEGSVYSGEIGKESMVDFSARGMMQGVVMSEILNRPVRRAARR